MSSKKKREKKKTARNVVQECLDRISASKKLNVKKAVPVEEPSSDNNTADRISPSAMPLKKRPAKKTVQEEEQLSDEGSSDSSPHNLEKFIFFTKAKLILSRIWSSSHTVYHGRDPEPRTFPE